MLWATCAALSCEFPAFKRAPWRERTFHELLAEAAAELEQLDETTLSQRPSKPPMAGGNGSPEEEEEPVTRRNMDPQTADTANPLGDARTSAGRGSAGRMSVGSSSPGPGGQGRSRSRRMSVTAMEAVDVLSAHMTTSDAMSDAEAHQSARIAEAAKQFLEVEKKQKAKNQSPGFWPKEASSAANWHLVGSGDGKSGAAKMVSYVSSAIIGAASLMCCFASVTCPGGTKCEELPVWAELEVICLAYFTCEYTVRVLTAHARPLDDSQQASGQFIAGGDDAASRALSPGDRAPAAPPRPSTRAFIFQPMNLIDLVSILPFLIEALISALSSMTDEDAEREGGPYQVVRILRILRVLRVLKLAEVSHSMSLFGRGLHRSRDYIITLSLTLVIITILFASLIFHFETGATPAATGVPDSIYGTDGGKAPRPPAGDYTGSPHHNLIYRDISDRSLVLTAGATDPANLVPQADPAVDLSLDLDLDLDLEHESSSDVFLSVPDVFWFCVSEITTVGNAPKSPSTPVGQAFAIVLACFGVFYLSFAQAVIVNSFQEVLREHRRTDDGGKQLKRIFDSQRKDVDGRVKCGDLHRAVRRYDAALATSLEVYLPLDDMQKREHDKRRESVHASINSSGAKNGGRPAGSIDYAFFDAVMQDAIAQRVEDGGDKAVDLESIAISVDLIKEDQDQLREELHEFFREHNHVVMAIAKSLKIQGLESGGANGEHEHYLPPGKEWHFFISHSQATGGDQANLITNNLEKRGLKIWYDNNMEEITESGMKEGVQKSKALIVLLTSGMMGRPFCQKEMKWALEFDLDIIGVAEQDPRRSPVVFEEEKVLARASGAPELESLVDDLEFISFRRRRFEAEGMYGEILKRGKFEAPDEDEMQALGQLPAATPEPSPRPADNAPRQAKAREQVKARNTMMDDLVRTASVRQDLRQQGQGQGQEQRSTTSAFLRGDSSEEEDMPAGAPLQRPPQQPHVQQAMEEMDETAPQEV